MTPTTDNLAMNQVGEPDAGNPHVRFDERGLETGRKLPRQPSTLLNDRAAAQRLRQTPHLRLSCRHQPGRPRHGDCIASVRKKARSAAGSICKFRQ